MIRGYDEAAVCWNVFSADPTNSPEQFTNQPYDGAEYVEEPLRKHSGIGACSVPLGLFGGSCRFVQDRLLLTQGREFSFGSRKLQSAVHAFELMSGGRDFIPPIGRVRIIQRVIVPALAMNAFKTTVLNRLGFRQTNAVASGTIGEFAAPLDLN